MGVNSVDYEFGYLELINLLVASHDFPDVNLTGLKKITCA